MCVAWQTTGLAYTDEGERAFVLKMNSWSKREWGWVMQIDKSDMKQDVQGVTREGNMKSYGVPLRETSGWVIMKIFFEEVISKKHAKSWRFLPGQMWRRETTPRLESKMKRDPVWRREEDWWAPQTVSFLVCTCHARWACAGEQKAIWWHRWA